MPESNLGPRFVEVKYHNVWNLALSSRKPGEDTIRHKDKIKLVMVERIEQILYTIFLKNDTIFFISSKDRLRGRHTFATQSAFSYFH